MTMTEKKTPTVYVVVEDATMLPMPFEPKAGDPFAMSARTEIVRSGYRFIVDDAFVRQTEDRFGSSPFADLSDARPTPSPVGRKKFSTPAATRAGARAWRSASRTIARMPRPRAPLRTTRS
jgi:hypothetical protein